MTIRFQAAAAFAALLLFHGRPFGQQGTLRRNVEGVRIDVAVTDGGRPVLGLTDTDFEVLDEDVPQTIQSSWTAQSLSLVLALDTSASVVFGRLEYPRQLHKTPENFTQLVMAARALASSLTARDEVSLMTFSDRMTLAVAPTVNAKAVGEALSQLDRLQSANVQIRSTVWDAAFAAASLAAARQGRPIVFLLSDGTDNASWLGQRDTAAALRSAGVAIDVISVPRTYDTLDEDPSGEWDPKEIADRTGGSAYSARDKDLPDKLRERLEILRSGYILTYVPSGVGRFDGWHKLSVRLRGKKGRVQSRPGYYTPETPPR